MLYVYYGTNEGESRSKARVLISGLQKKAPDAELVRVTSESDGAVDIDNLLGTQGLFKQSYILFLDGVDDVFLGFSDIQLGLMKQSSHICIVLLGKLTKPQTDTIKKYANKTTECTELRPPPQKYNVFSVANALKARSKQELWQSLAEARHAGSEGEALVGMLFWAVKDMLVKEQHSTFTKQELRALAVELAQLPHKARREAVSIHNALEAFALSSI